MRSARRITRALSLLAVALGSLAATRAPGADPAPPAQVLRPEVEIWSDFFRGCSQATAADGAYACACAATWMVGACREDPTGIVSCMDRMRAAPSFAGSVRTRCGRYGTLTTVDVPNAVDERAPPAPHQLGAWNGGYRGCMESATPEERRRSPSMAYTCACVATFLTNACVAAPGASRDGYGECVHQHAPDIQRASQLCLRYGHLAVQ